MGHFYSTSKIVDLQVWLYEQRHGFQHISKLSKLGQFTIASGEQHIWDHKVSIFLTPSPENLLSQIENVSNVSIIGKK
jgi:hypothetical protein